MTAQPETAYTEAMRDAAYAANIDPRTWQGAVGGYYGGPRALNMWTVADWARFGGRKKLPIWVAGMNGTQEGQQAAQSLLWLGKQPGMKPVPRGAWTALDMETRVDKTYVQAFGWELAQAGGWKVWVYGSASTVFGNPPLDGYWVADYAGVGPFMWAPQPGNESPGEVRATQYAPGPAYDSSTVKSYTLAEGTWWV
jgi:hypothetical protein